MASGYQKMNVIGNLGRDPAVTYKADLAICEFSVAVTERRKGKDGAYGEQTTWFRVKCFGKTAEACGQYLAKGKQVYVEGRLEVETYVDKKTNETRVSIDLIASEVKFLGSAPGKDSAGGAHAPAKAAPAQGDGFVDDDLPFARCEPVGVWW